MIEAQTLEFEKREKALLDKQNKIHLRDTQIQSWYREKQTHAQLQQERTKSIEALVTIQQQEVQEKTKEKERMRQEQRRKMMQEMLQSNR